MPQNSFKAAAGRCRLGTPRGPPPQAELNAIHLFARVTGTQRAFLEAVGAIAGHPIDVTRIDPVAWNEASIIGFQRGDNEPMCRVISGAVLDEKAARIAAHRERAQKFNEAQKEKAADHSRGRGGRSR